jgi:hypothetical protein
MENGFSTSTLRLNQEIAKYAVWNEASIIDRVQKLAKIAKAYGRIQIGDFIGSRCGLIGSFC